MPDLKTFDEIKTRIKRLDEVNKEIKVECIEAINKQQTYDEAFWLKNGEYCQQKRPQADYH